MNNNNEVIQSISTERLLSFIFIIIGFANIYADNLLISSIENNDPSLSNKASTIFLWGLILSLILYIVIVSRNYTAYKEKKDAGNDATPELKRLFGSLLVLVGFIIIFNYFLETGFDSELPPVL